MKTIRISVQAYKAIWSASRAINRTLNVASATQTADGGWEIEVDEEVYERMKAFASAGDMTMSDIILMLTGGQPS